ncbi:hypothetical protein H0H93_004769 [Arthromyces matolae]|nr:hypothetical protein H0H93_004769 [Arthromyces matolae]
MDLFSRALHHSATGTLLTFSSAETEKPVQATAGGCHFSPWTLSADPSVAPPGMLDEEQVGGGYSLRPNIKTTPLAQGKGTNHDDLLAVQRMAKRRQENPEYAPAPELSSYNDRPASKNTSALTGWEGVPDEDLVPLTSDHIDPIESDSYSPPGSPTPRQPRLKPTTSTAMLGAPDDPKYDNADSDEGEAWGWDAGDTNVQASKGRRTNVIRRKIDHGFETIREHFRQIAEETGTPVSTLHSEFHSRHSLTTSTSDWRVYESYYKHNRKQEIARHRDEDGNAVPDATGIECWSTFKLLPNHRKMLSTFRDLRITLDEKTVRQRRRTFDQTFNRFCTLMDRAHDENFEVCIWMVGGCVNEDGSLASYHCTPGLTELPDRFGTTAEEIVTFAKIEAYRVRGIAASKEIIEARKTATRSERLESLSATATTSSTMTTADSEDVKQEKPMSAESLRNACKNAMFDMFTDFGHPLKGTKGKGRAAESGPNQMPWSTLPGMLVAMGVQLNGWPWEVEPPSNHTTQGIKVLPTGSARSLLSSLQGHEFVTPYLKLVNSNDLRSNKVPVIVSTAPPPEAVDLYGHVVFGDAKWVKNSKDHGLPRQASGATTIRGKAKHGHKKNPIAVSSSSPPDTPADPPSTPRKVPSKTRPRPRRKVTRFVTSDSRSEGSEDDYQGGSEEEEDDDDHNSTITKMLPLRPAPKPVAKSTRYVDDVSSDEAPQNPLEAGKEPKMAEGQSGTKVADVVAKGRRLATSTLKKAAKATTSAKASTSLRPISQIPPPVVGARVVQPVVEIQTLPRPLPRPVASTSTRDVAHSPPITAIRISEPPIIQPSTSTTSTVSNVAFATTTANNITAVASGSSDSTATILNSTAPPIIASNLGPTYPGGNTAVTSPDVSTAISNVAAPTIAASSSNSSLAGTTAIGSPNVVAGSTIASTTIPSSNLGVAISNVAGTTAPTDVSTTITNVAGTTAPTTTPNVGGTTAPTTVVNVSTTIPNVGGTTAPTTMVDVSTTILNEAGTTDPTTLVDVSTTTPNVAGTADPTAVVDVSNVAGTAVSTIVDISTTIPNVAGTTAPSAPTISTNPSSNIETIFPDKAATTASSIIPNVDLDGVLNVAPSINIAMSNTGGGSTAEKRCASPLDSEPPSKRLREQGFNSEAQTNGLQQQPTMGTSAVSSIPVPHVKLEAPEGHTSPPFVPQMMWYGPPSIPVSTRPSPVPEGGLSSPLPSWHPTAPPPHGIHPQPSSTSDTMNLGTPHPPPQYPWFAPPPQNIRPSPAPEASGVNPDPNVRQASAPPSHPWDANNYQHGYHPFPPAAPHPFMQENRPPPTQYNPYYPHGMYGPAYGAPHYPPPTNYGGFPPGYNLQAPTWNGGPGEGTQPGAHPSGSSTNQG